MTVLIELAPLWRALILTVTLILCFAAIYCIISAFALRQKAWRVVLYTGLFALEYVLYQPMFDITFRKYFGPPPSDFILAFAHIPVWLVLLILTVLAVLTIHIIARIQVWKRTHLSPGSIKESVDILPTGLCFCARNGTVLLANQRMESLCHTLTDKALLDANAFWDALTTGTVNDAATVISTTQSPVFHLPDDSVWSFGRQPLETKLGSVQQITAVDITENYHAGLELEKQVRQLRKMNARLQLYNERVSDTTREEELLTTKVKIHDKLGRALITTRRYIENHDAPPQEELLRLWTYNVALLRRENESDPMDDPLREIGNAAELAGLKLHILGKLPAKDKSALRVLKAAALESINNAAHHAGATELTIMVRNSVTYYMFTFTNNGLPPGGLIIEGGGLTGLRHRVQQAHGVMRIESSPRFVLKISVPQKELLGDDECIDC